MEFFLAYMCLKSAMENPVSLRVALADLTENLIMLSRHSAVLFVRLFVPVAVLLLCRCGFTDMDTSAGDRHYQSV
ncbi:hypothetical protein [Pantoea vagans]|uniref:hypothetical protein n=1 Tax=Pantoea vagans TaxID=470934 RepID=UPI00320B543B